MCAQFSDGILEAMGLRRSLEFEELTAVFSSLHVFAVNGLNADRNYCEEFQTIVDGVPCSFAVGYSVNEICMKLLKDNFIDDEVEWAKYKKYGAPYLMIRIGPTAVHKSKGVFGMWQNGDIHTYECFSEAKDELKTVSKRVLPSLISSLAASVLSHDNEINFPHIEDAYFGITPTGQTIHDMRFTINATASVLTRMEIETLKDRLQSAAGRAQEIDLRIASFTNTALKQVDHWKRFYIFFIVIEMSIQGKFKTLSNGTRGAPANSNTLEIPKIKSIIRQNDTSAARTLVERFCWCVLSVWHHLDDRDLENLKLLKKVRDDLSHGNISTASDSDAKIAEKLALKILSR